MLDHPIVLESFAIIDGEVGPHSLGPEAYAICRRVIHATADFDFLHLLSFSSEAIAAGIAGLRGGTPIITDVNLVKLGIASLNAKTFQCPLISALEGVETPPPGKTRSETGILRCYQQYPGAIYVIGNAPTALLALCRACAPSRQRPSLIIGAPVGFVAVLESKAALASLDGPKIIVEGRKGGSAAAAAILNALIVLAWN
ncbi:MAG: cobalt-precorrin-8X methylmutase [Chloroflexaceae bacterium]|nr:cobalt-precorrin-8X methylmutase [Chloroflexaceae bacterium]